LLGEAVRYLAKMNFRRDLRANNERPDCFFPLTNLSAARRHQGGSTMAARHHQASNKRLSHPNLFNVTLQRT